MKLYSKPGACSTADHIALQWTGEAFEVEVVSQTQIKEPWFLEINPAGSVPVIVDGDFVLTQNAAIMGYIADRYPAAQLTGDGSPRQRAEATRWLSFCNADIHPAFGPLFNPGGYCDDKAQFDNIREKAGLRVRKYYEIADQRLGEADGWLAGFRSFADPYLYVMMGWAKKMGIELGDLPHLAAFHKKMSADAGVQAALKAEGLI